MRWLLGGYRLIAHNSLRGLIRYTYCNGMGQSFLDTYGTGWQRLHLFAERETEEQMRARLFSTPTASCFPQFPDCVLTVLLWHFWICQWNKLLIVNRREAKEMEEKTSTNNKHLWTQLIKCCSHRLSQIQIWQRLNNARIPYYYP
jgi:hypothetical protein